jgi:hypothetical protein
MTPWKDLAERTGLEPATPGVTGRYSNQLNYRSSKAKIYKTTVSDRLQTDLAERTGLEPATPGVTGRYSNQLNYRSGIWIMVGAEGLEPPTLAL